MTDMLERAARALCVIEGVDPDRPAFGGQPEWRYRVGAASAALLAALDPEDEALVEAVAADLFDQHSMLRSLKKWEETDASDPAKQLYRVQARGAIRAISRMAQGDTVD